jgi:hypothetical protein
MTLKEYFERLQEFIKANPEALELEVITSKDDEGNGFNEVSSEPSKGHYDGDCYTSVEMFREYGINGKINSVCIN